MADKRFATSDEIAAAKVAGWHVFDLNTPAAQVRGPNWALKNPAGVIVDYGWTPEDAWRGILPSVIYPPKRFTLVVTFDGDESDECLSKVKYHIDYLRERGWIVEEKSL